MQISSGSVTRDCNWSEVSLKGKNVNLMPDIEPGKNVNTPPGKPSMMLAILESQHEYDS